MKAASRRETLGSTSFKVQEFEPDRLKVRLDLTDAPIEGWLQSTDVQARVNVQHLFGAAASGRRVEGEPASLRAAAIHTLPTFVSRWENVCRTRIRNRSRPR